MKEHKNNSLENNPKLAWKKPEIQEVDIEKTHTDVPPFLPSDMEQYS